MNIPRNWTFESEGIAAGFDRHVRDQLPFYAAVSGAVAHVARHYVAQGGLVYDLGASTGNVGRALAAVLDDRAATLVPIEASAALCARYAGPGRVLCRDAREITFQPFDLAVCFLFLMFLPIPDRAALLGRLRAAVKPGGAIVVVDKEQAGSGYAATVLWRLALAGKVAAGVPPAEVVGKELSLAGVQRPLRSGELGADAVEWFRFGDFAGWLIEG